MTKLTAAQIFVPGGMPERTYIRRTKRQLEEQLTAAKDNLCKLVTVTGTTKSGKTVLVNKIFPRAQNIWVDGGSIGNENDFWSLILEGLGGYTDKETQDSESSEYGIESGIEGEGGIPLLAKAKGQVGSSYKRNRGQEQSKNLTLTPRAAAISQLRINKTPIIIDDFHYIDREFQGTIIRALKPLIFDGLPVILIAIPHHRYDVVKVEREMTGRLEPIHVPVWELKELILIPQIGFPLLNVNISAEVCDLLAKEAYGSPFLMQEFCRELAKVDGISEFSFSKKEIITLKDGLFEGVAEQTGKPIFDKLAKGPTQRSDRIQRKLKNGQTADIYKVILLSLSDLRPGLETVDYENLRSSIKSILAENIPQANEVTRVLEQMSNIASSDEASPPVLDWEKSEQQLHITDPFFAFFLKWGVKPTVSQSRTNLPIQSYDFEVYVSYAWGGDSEQTVDELERVFASRGVRLVRDKKDLGYKGSIKEFEQRIGQGQAVILVISDKYLRSEHCMYELVEIDRNKDFQNRVFPIVLSDARIYKATERLAYIKHWDEQVKILNQAIKQVSEMSNLSGFLADLDKYARIRNEFDNLVNLLSDMNALTFDIHEANGFSTLINAIEKAFPEK